MVKLHDLTPNQALRSPHRATRGAGGYDPDMRGAALLCSFAWGSPAWAADLGRPPGPDLSGTWRVDLVLVHEAQAPLLGELVVRSHQVNLAVVEATPEGWWQRHEPCDLVSTSPVALAATSFPPRFIASLPRKEYPVSLEAVEGEWRYGADYGFHAVGFDAERAGGRMPVDAGDPSVRDSDGDGKPGATIEVHVPVLGTVQLYMVQQAHTVVSGAATLGAGGEVARIEGALGLRQSGQNTLEASNRLFAANPKVRFLPEQSSFQMVRVEPATRCDALTLPAG
jgi:hypothetical protein